MLQLLQTIKAIRTATARKLTVNPLRVMTANAANRANAGLMEANRANAELMEANRANAEPMEANRANAVRVTVTAVTVVSAANAPTVRVQALISLQHRRNMLKQLWKTECLRLTRPIHPLLLQPMHNHRKPPGLHLPAVQLPYPAAPLPRAACPR